MASAKKVAKAPTLAERKAAKNAEAEQVATSTDPMFDFYINRLESLNKRYHITSSSLSVPNKLSSGNLVIDLITNGGLNGFVQYSGQEASSKTTAATHAFGSALDAKILPIYRDPENAIDPPYFGNITGRSHIDVFGKKSPKTGEYLIRPKAFYSDDQHFESFFLYMRDFLLSLPEKRYMEETDQWYLVYPAAKDGVKERLKKLGLVPSKELFTATGKYWCPTDKRGPSSFVVLDSWPALLSEDNDTDGNDSGGGMSLAARKFAEFLPKVVGKLRSRGMIMLGVNQIREKPAQRIPVLYEPGGKALAFYCNTRLRFFANGVPHLSSYKEAEDEASSWSEGTDRYQYKRILVTKLKSGQAKLEGLVRVWTKDSRGQGRGYCPAYDVFQYLTMTGHIAGKRNGFKIVEFGDADCSKKLTFSDLKKYVLASYEDLNAQKESAKMFGYKSYLNLRTMCFNEITNGLAYKRMIDRNQLKGIKAEGEAEDLEAD